MPTHTFAFLRDYFSARGWTLTKTGKEETNQGISARYKLTNGIKTEYFATIQQLQERAGKP